MQIPQPRRPVTTALPGRPATVLRRIPRTIPAATPAVASVPPSTATTGAVTTGAVTTGAVFTRATIALVTSAAPFLGKRKLEAAQIRRVGPTATVC